LDGGTTAHSIFRIPIQIYDNSTCNININSDLAECIRQADIIVWDEAVMGHKHIYMAVDRSFRDIMKQKDLALQHQLFGGKTIIFGGDFRQVKQ
jgi:ATP-dependent DNA helicase PIF1